MNKLRFISLASAMLGLSSMPSAREIPTSYPNPSRPYRPHPPHTGTPPRRKSRRQKYRAPAYSGPVDPRHIHPKHLRAKDGK